MTLPDPYGLRTLFGGQFYQSFGSEYGRISAALWQTLNQSTSAELTAMIDGIDAVLAGDPSSKALELWYQRVGLGVYPPGRGDGPTHRQFLEWIRQEAREELARHTAAPGQGPAPLRPLLDSWTHGHIRAFNANEGTDRVSAMLTHPSATIEVLVAADRDDRPEEVLADDHWLLCLDGMLTLDVDEMRMVLGQNDVLALPAGTRFLMAAARPDSRWLRIRLPRAPWNPTDLTHPGAIY